MYVCVECDNELFSSVSKYEHATPWPAFTETIRKDSVTKTPEPGRPKAIKVLFYLLKQCNNLIKKLQRSAVASVALVLDTSSLRIETTVGQDSEYTVPP